MGVPGGQSPRRVNTALVATILGLIVAVALVAAVVVGSTSKKGDTAGTRQTFDAGPTKDLAKVIARDRQPVLYPDALNRGRPIYVQHLGTDLAHGWRAFGAYDPARPSCLVEWAKDRQLFVDQCDRSTTYPADGHGLTQFATRVDKDHLIVDLHRP